MKTNYGNTFNHGIGDNVSVSVEVLWPQVDVFAPIGGYVAKSDTYPKDTKIPAGTVVQLDTPGSTPLLGDEATAPTGLTYEDAYIGDDGCSLTVVVQGIINESLSSVTYTTAQKQALPRITFIKEA